MSLSLSGFPGRSAERLADLKPCPKPAGANQRLALSQTVKILAVSIGLLLAVKFGAAIADALGTDTPWLTLACLTAPIVIVSAIYWLIGRLL